METTEIEESNAINGLLLVLMAKCLRRSTITDDDVFFEHAPHVKAVFVRVFLGGWERDAREDLNFYISYGPAPSSQAEIIKVIEQIDNFDNFDVEPEEATV